MRHKEKQQQQQQQQRVATNESGKTFSALRRILTVKVDENITELN